MLDIKISKITIDKRNTTPLHILNNKTSVTFFSIYYAKVRVKAYNPTLIYISTDYTGSIIMYTQRRNSHQVTSIVLINSVITFTLKSFAASF